MEQGKISSSELRQAVKRADPVLPLEKLHETEGTDYLLEKEHQVKSLKEQDYFDSIHSEGPDATKKADVHSKQDPLQTSNRILSIIKRDEAEKRLMKQREEEEERRLEAMMEQLRKTPYKQNVENPHNPIPEPLEELDQVDMLREIMKFDAPTITIFGSRGTGKTWVARNLMSLMRNKFCFGLVISATAFTKFWAQHVPGWYILSSFDPVVVRAFLRRQRELREMIENGQLDANIDVFVVLDDIIHDERFRFNQELNEIYVAGRHSKITIITLSQKVKGVNTTWRSNTDLAIVLQQYRGPEIDTLYEEFGYVIDKKDFRKMLELNTKQHRALVVCNKEKNGIIANRFKTFKAVDPGPFILGCKEFWDPPDSYKEVMDAKENRGRV